MNNQENILELENICRSYRVGDEVLEVLRGVNWQVKRGEWACILGASGSGKTTLLHLIGALERPDRGMIRVAGVELNKLRRGAAARFRNRKLGFIFQSYHLLPELSILENAALPGRFSGMRVSDAVKRAEELLVAVGLKDRLRHRPGELSGGEQQRAAIARALINDPELLLADEPTGNLDSKTGAGILELFSEMRRVRPERSIIMITHNQEIAALCDSVSVLQDGLFA